MLKTMLSLNIEDTFRRALKTHLRVHVMYTQKKEGSATYQPRVHMAHLCNYY